MPASWEAVGNEIKVTLKLGGPHCCYRKVKKAEGGREQVSTTVAWNLGASLDQRKGIGEGVGVRETRESLVRTH